MGMIKDKVNDPNSSPLRRYQDVVIGTRSLAFLCWYELLQMFIVPMPGALGLFVRSRLYRLLLGSIGHRSVIGRNVTLRHPKSIKLGRSVVVDECCVLDGHTSHVDEPGVSLAEGTMIARNTQINAKGGRVRIGQRVGIGAGGVFHAGEGCAIEIGDDVLIGPFACVGGTIYRFDRLDVPIAAQGVDARGGVRIGAGAWLGAGVTIVDGASVGEGAIVAAGAVVTNDIPDLAIVGGVPAKVIRYREQQRESVTSKEQQPHTVGSNV